MKTLSEQLKELSELQVLTHPSALLNKKQLARLTGLSTETIRVRFPKWIAAGLKTIKLEDRTCVRLSDWDKFVISIRDGKNKKTDVL